MNSQTIATIQDALIFAYKSSIPENDLEAALAELAALEQAEWSYRGQATIDVYGGGLIKMRMDGPFPAGAPDSGVYDIVFRFIRRTTAQEATDE